MIPFLILAVAAQAPLDTVSPIGRMVQTLRGHRAVEFHFTMDTYPVPTTARVRLLAPCYGEMRTSQQIVGTNGQKAWMASGKNKLLYTYKPETPLDVFQESPFFGTIVGGSAPMQVGPAKEETYRGKKVVVVPIVVQGDQSLNSHMALLLDPKTWLPVAARRTPGIGKAPAPQYLHLLDFKLDPPLTPADFRVPSAD